MVDDGLELAGHLSGNGLREIVKAPMHGPLSSSSEGPTVINGRVLPRDSKSLMSNASRKSSESQARRKSGQP